MDKRKEVNRIVRESLAEALVQCMQIKPFNSITVTEIIEKAGVARATYYRNFDSKEDLAREYISTLADEFTSTHTDLLPLTSYDTILSLIEYIDAHRDILTLYARSGLADLIFDSLSDVDFYNVNSAHYAQIDVDEFTIFSGALYGMIRKWMLDGASESPRELADKFCNIWNKR